MRSLKASVCGLVGIAVASVLFVGCGGAKTLKKDSGSPDDAKSVYPAAIEKLMDGKYSASIKAVGMGTHPDETVAIEKAGLDADAKIARQFEQEVSALQKRFLEAVNDQKLEEYRNTVENFTTLKVQGVTIVKEMASEGADGYKGFVLKVVSAETMKNLIDERTNALTNFKAIQAYKELDERVAKEKAARAAE